MGATAAGTYGIIYMCFKINISWYELLATTEIRTYLAGTKHLFGADDDDFLPARSKAPKTETKKKWMNICIHTHPPVRKQSRQCGDSTKHICGIGVVLR